jgi:hypothetical protein
MTVALRATIGQGDKLRCGDGDGRRQGGPRQITEAIAAASTGTVFAFSPAMLMRLSLTM